LAHGFDLCLGLIASAYRSVNFGLTENIYILKPRLGTREKNGYGQTSVCCADQRFVDGWPHAWCMRNARQQQ
ncbi:MAG: hypothetical protein Q4B54_07870, partial [Coriobacteriales bacterium]|nr:hypothetical protein [Coriobacteriales bacterium]